MRRTVTYAKKAKQPRATVERKPRNMKEVQEFLFGTNRPPSDALPEDIGKRLSAHLQPIIDRLVTVNVSARVGLNWKIELVRVAGRLSNLAAGWPQAKTDLAAPEGYAWCTQCSAFARPRDCAYGGCPIRWLRTGVAAKRLPRAKRRPPRAA